MKQILIMIFLVMLSMACEKKSHSNSTKLNPNSQVEAVKTLPQSQTLIEATLVRLSASEIQVKVSKVIDKGRGAATFENGELITFDTAQLDKSLKSQIMQYKVNETVQLLCKTNPLKMGEEIPTLTLISIRRPTT